MPDDGDQADSTPTDEPKPEPVEGEGEGQSEYLDPAEAFLELFNPD